MKKVTITDFLTEDQINQAIEIYKTEATGQRAKSIAEKIISPNLEEINQKLGQENDARYLGYVVEYVLMETEKRGGLR